MLADARSRRGLTIEDVSASTRLRRGLLEEMESDDFSATGGDVYARGHLRTLAGVLEMDPDTLIEAYETASSVTRPPAP